MPTYEYACTECGDRIDVVQRFTDDPLTVCSACGGKLRKLFSAVGIVFKGSGFYRTDSRNGSSSVKAGTNGSGGSGSDGGSSGSGSDGASSGSDKSDKATDSSASGSASGDSAGSKSGTSSAGGDKKAAVSA